MMDRNYPGKHVMVFVYIVLKIQHGSLFLSLECHCILVMDALKVYTTLKITATSLVL